METGGSIPRGGVLAGKTGAALSGGEARLHPRRFRAPLYSPGEAARIVGVSYGRFNSWTKPSIEGHSSSGLVTKVEPWKKLSVPFVGLAEAMVLKELTNHASMGCLRKALSKISMSAEHPPHLLATERFYRSGGDILYNFTDNPEEFAKLCRINSDLKQYVFAEVIENYLEKLSPVFDENGYTKIIRLPYYEVAEVVIDPHRGGGDPIFADGGCRVRSVLKRFAAGEAINDCAREFNVPKSHIEDALRVLSKQAA